MGYLHIDNLYKNQDVLMFKECYAMEKIHGTSAHISFKENRINYFAGGANHAEFVKLFDEPSLLPSLINVAQGKSVHVYGEAYGGSMQGMKATYGDKLKFVVFEVKIGDTWLNVANAEDVARKLGLEFVHYKKVSTKLEDLDAERDAPSVQAVRNGMEKSTDKWGFSPPIREGIVIRPLVEMVRNGERVIAKHKRDELRETATPRAVMGEEMRQKIADAQAIATEWVVLERLNHVLDTLRVDGHQPGIEDTSKVLKLMTEDIIREADNEIDDTPAVRKEINRATALLYKEWLKQGLYV